MSVTETTDKFLESAKAFLCKVLWTKELSDSQLVAAKSIAGCISRDKDLEKSYALYLGRHNAGMMGKTSPINKRKYTNLYKALDAVENRIHLRAICASMPAGWPSVEEAEEQTPAVDPSVELELPASEVASTPNEPTQEQPDTNDVGSSSNTIWSAQD